MTTGPHVAVIGAGVLGMCTAANLAARGARVTVLDAGAIASGSSGRSVGVVGTQFTDPFDVALRVHALRQLRGWEAAGLVFHRIGYLRLARTAAQMELLARSVEIQAEAGLSARLCRAADLARLVPHMNVGDLAGGIFGADNGFIDPHALCMLLAAMVRERDGRVHAFRRLLGVRRRHGGYVLETPDGEVACDMAVNAAGAWAPAVAELFGQAVDVRGERHEAVAVLLDEPLPYTMPMVMDLVNGVGTGLNFRHDAPGALIAEVHRPGAERAEDPDRYNEACDEDSKVRLAELLLQRLPDLPGARLGRGWAGLYPVTPDHRPLVGPVDPAEPGLVTAAGAGGYGIQLGPVIGQLAADWLLDGGPASLPGAAALAPGRGRAPGPGDRAAPTSAIHPARFPR